jgi:hypothetical protein
MCQPEIEGAINSSLTILTATGESSHRNPCTRCLYIATIFGGVASILSRLRVCSPPARRYIAVQRQLARFLCKTARRKRGRDDARIGFRPGSRQVGGPPVFCRTASRYRQGDAAAENLAAVSGLCPVFEANRTKTFHGGEWSAVRDSADIQALFYPYI